MKTTTEIARNYFDQRQIVRIGTKWKRKRQPMITKRMKAAIIDLACGLVLVIVGYGLLVVALCL